MIIDDSRGWQDYYRNLLKDYDLEVFGDGVSAIMKTNEMLPAVVILDLLLVGPTGISVLNEMQSYDDLKKVPVVVVSDMVRDDLDLSEYGVVRAFDKSKMLPVELVREIQKWI
mgnify:CR=1 FL=1